MLGQALPTAFLISVFGLMGLPAPIAHAAQPAPSTPVRPVVDDYFGIKITDPYRYLENLADPEVQTWFKAQAEYAGNYFDHLATRQAFVTDIEKYVNSEPASIHDIRRTFAGHYFFLKTLPTENTAKLYMRQGIDGPDTLLVDTDKFAGPKGQPAAINYYSVSHDDRYVAVGISTGGSEMATLHILDTQTGKESAETIDRAEFGGVAWRPDNQSFFYNRLQAPGDKPAPNSKFLNSTIFLHQVGASPETDRAIFRNGLSPRVQISPVDEPGVAIRPDSDFAIGIVEHGVQREQTLYAAPAAALDKDDIPWTKICDVPDQVSSFTFRGNDIFLLSHKNASHFKLLKLDLQHPDIARATVMVPAGDGILRSMDATADALYLKETLSGTAKITRIPCDGAPSTVIPLPYHGGVGFASSDPRLPGILLAISSWTKGAVMFQYDNATNQVTPTHLLPVGPFDNRDDITSETVLAPSYDGALVPLTIIHRTDIKLDGSNPTIISAYGAYGMTSEPGFNLASLPWLDRGGVYCIGHVRGGGENGQDWYRAGYKVTKPNTWRDVIACAQYLINKKYTSPSHLAIVGGSAGGITMGRAITARPDLFAAANIRAGCVNALRIENSPNGPPNIPEFGTTTTQEGFEDLYAMDALHHVRDGVAYPAVLLTIGMNDPRVEPWESGKFAARLQAATAGSGPILLRVDYAGGHGIGASKQQRIEQTADMYAFFLAQFHDSPAGTR
jgi:prolyl oligopeptidase